MDTSDSSSDDGDHLHTPLQLPDSNTTIASSSNESTDLFDFAQPKYLRSSHVSRSVSPLFPEEQHSHFGVSTQLSSHAHADFPHNALQLQGAYQPVLTSQDSQSSFASSCESTPPPYQLHDQLPSVPFPPEPRHPSPSCATSCPRISRPSRSKYHVTTKASAYSRRFPRGHFLNPEFVQWYHLGDELGAGGYGFVMTAVHRLELREVAVKFIIKAKVPEHAWMEDKSARRVPTEALLLGLLDHPNIVKCVDLFEDELYFYLVQELHGTPWVSQTNDSPPQELVIAPGKASSHLSTPALTPSPSVDSDIQLPDTPPQFSTNTGDLSRASGNAKQLCASPKDLVLIPTEPCPPYIRRDGKRGVFLRRPSHDLFECIEQSKDKRLSERQARFVFAQIVEAIHYLDSQGVSHCDVKDENILVDSYLNVKLVDFGSAVVVDPAEPRPLYTLFFGTTAYAASEVLQKKPYRAPPAEIWTLGVLLSYLLTGASPFPTERDAIAGRVILASHASAYVSESAERLMLRCLDPDPERRANIHEVRTHQWLDGALDLPLDERIL
ncbi:kinase-like domain-containing protein [Lactarius vividus]|nr:kinase-like domain-containing protein [Lactarius vividus]